MMFIRTILALFLATFHLAVPVAQAQPLPVVPGAFCLRQYALCITLIDIL
jgi:hypothetical protein